VFRVFQAVGIIDCAFSVLEVVAVVAASAVVLVVVDLMTVGDDPLAFTLVKSEAILALDTTELVS
jgi:hypothetical protein